MLRPILFLFVCAAALAGAASADRSTVLEGVPIHYEVYDQAAPGNGNDALVFIHGWTCDLTFWREQAPVYQNHRSLLIDLPGHGESGKPRRAYPVEFFARAVEAAMRDAGIERAVLIGHSLGGPIAYAFLRMFSEKAKGLILVDADVTLGSAGSIDDVAQRQKMARRAGPMEGPRGDRSFARRVESMFSGGTPEPVRQQVRAKMLATPRYVRIAALTSPSMLPPPALDEAFGLPAIAIQALSRGTQARYQAMRRLFPALRLEAWEGAGHFLMMEDPGRFNRSLETFLAGLP